VLILDPESALYEPYWVSLDRLVQAMTTTDIKTNKSRGGSDQAVNAPAMGLTALAAHVQPA